jgi:hypothetical protein
MFYVIGDSSGHREDLPGARILQEEGRGWPGGPLQRDEGLFHPRSRGRILSGIRIHRWTPPHAGQDSNLRSSFKEPSQKMFTSSKLLCFYL